jgi:hypothetical protein
MQVAFPPVLFYILLEDYCRALLETSYIIPSYLSLVCTPAVTQYLHNLRYFLLVLVFHQIPFKYIHPATLEACCTII